MHDIGVALNVHLDWVVLQADITNVFNIVFCKVIFLRFICCRWAVVSTHTFCLFFYHHSPQGDLFIIQSSIGTCQGDPLGRPLFALVHFYTLCSFARLFSSCLFPSIANDTHIIQSISIVFQAFHHLFSQLNFVSLMV